MYIFYLMFSLNKKKLLQLGCRQIVENEMILEHLNDEVGLMQSFFGMFDLYVLSDSTLRFFNLFTILCLK